jgi:hypothetical protein
MNMAAELMAVLPGLSYETVMDFGWFELKDWHSRAVKVFKKIHGRE